MDHAPLELGLGQVVSHGGGESSVRIGNHELHALEPALVELTQQVCPAVLRFLGTDGEAEELPLPVGTDAVGDGRRDVLDLPRPTGIEERRVRYR